MLDHIKKFYILPSVLALLAASAFLVYSVHFIYREATGQVDSLISVGASALPEILPPDLPDRAVAPPGLSAREELDLREKLNNYAKLAGFSGLYILTAGEDGKLRFLVSTVSEKQGRPETFRSFSPYEQAPPAFYQTLESGRTSYATYDDERGASRSVAIRFTSPGGRHYLACASMSVDDIEKAVHRNIVFAILIVLVFVVLLVSFILVIRKAAYMYSRLSDLARANSELYRRATYDNLTGLLARGTFFDQAGTQLRRMAQLKSSGAVVMLDIDNFKQVNDKRGHQMGDTVLSAVAGICRMSLRSYDMVGRYGGEEIVMLLVRLDGPLAIAVAERLRESISRLTFNDHGEEFSVTATLGIVSFDRPEQDLSHYIELADKKLLEGKENGKNQVRCLMLGRKS